jgi:hypothetical protein
MFGINFYQAGAFIMLTGLLSLSIQMLRNGILPWVSSLWVLSFVFAISTIVVPHPLLSISAGVSFGAAYVLSGIELLRQQTAITIE